jgi:Fe2+ or Zn2+ uptake regulation protein
MNFEELENRLRDKKMRVTQARKEIFSLLQKSSKSLTPKEIFEQIKTSSGTDLASVYRNLTLFQEMGLAHRFQDGSFSNCHHDHYEHDGHRHIHFISHCVECGKKDEIQSHSKKVCSLANEIGKLSHTLTTLNEVVVQGLCAKCDK